jgi:hypothetical protein
VSWLRHCEPSAFFSRRSSCLSTFLLQPIPLEVAHTSDRGAVPFLIRGIKARACARSLGSNRHRFRSLQGRQGGADDEGFAFAISQRDVPTVVVNTAYVRQSRASRWTPEHIASAVPAGMLEHVKRCVVT